MRRPSRDIAQPEHIFFFDLGNGFVIDGAVDGNSERWINHSCVPNCEPVIDGARIFIRAFRQIKVGEELSAIDFLTKPIEEDALIAAVNAAISNAGIRQREASDAAALKARYDTLTPREQKLLPLLIQGLLNKQAAGLLGITEYTVQVHRGHIMKKMQADSFATLVRQAGRLQLDESGKHPCDA